MAATKSQAELDQAREQENKRLIKKYPFLRQLIETIKTNRRSLFQITEGELEPDSFDHQQWQCSSDSGYEYYFYWHLIRKNREIRPPSKKVDKETLGEYIERSVIKPDYLVLQYNVTKVGSDMPGEKTDWEDFELTVYKYSTE